MPLLAYINVTVTCLVLVSSHLDSPKRSLLCCPQKRERRCTCTIYIYLVIIVTKRDFYTWWTVYIYSVSVYFSILFYVNFMFCFYYRISVRRKCKKLIKIKDNKAAQFVCDNCTSTGRISPEYILDQQEVTANCRMQSSGNLSLFEMSFICTFMPCVVDTYCYSACF